MAGLARVEGEPARYCLSTAASHKDSPAEAPDAHVISDGKAYLQG